MSWAVPRGPSLNPADKRMAVHVEDHPISYFDFEGVIPKGEYGGGDVIVWDWGTWEPEETDDPGKAVRKGELKMRLDGEKLRGRFTLVKTRGSKSGPDDWLLIHKKDDDADPDWDVDDHPRSVKTGRTNDEVLAGADAMWDSKHPRNRRRSTCHGAREGPVARLRCARWQATLVDRPFDDDDWLFELKLDGYRIEAVVDGRQGSSSGRATSRTPRATSPTSPPRSQRGSGRTTAIVDGEVVALDERRRADVQPAPGSCRDGPFRAARRRARQASGKDKAEKPDFMAPVVYFVFDLIYLDGRLARRRAALEQRKKLASKRASASTRTCATATHVDGDGKAFFEASRKQGLEGLMAKLRTSRYEPGRRSKSWLKIKIRREQEAIVVGYEPGKGTRADLGSLDPGRVRGQGPALRRRGRQRHQHEDESRAEESTSTRTPSRRRRSSTRRASSGAVWSKPRHVVRVEFTEWTDDGLPAPGGVQGLRHRQGSAQGVSANEKSRRARPATRLKHEVSKAGHGTNLCRQGHDDGDPFFEDEDDRTDPPQAATLDEMAALGGARPRRAAGTIGGQRSASPTWTRCSSPSSGFTKRDLIRYYVTIAPVMLPYLRDRPLNLSRWPDGVNGKTFWQKQSPHLHARVDRALGLPGGGIERVAHLPRGRPRGRRWPGWPTTQRSTCTRGRRRSTTYRDADLRPDRHRPGHQDDVRRGRHARQALPNRAGASRRHGAAQGDRQARHPDLGADQADVHVPRRRAHGSKRCRGRLAPRSPSSSAGSGPRRRARAWRGSTSPRTRSTRRWSRRTRSGRWPTPAVSAPIEWDELDDPELRPDRWDIRTVLDRVRERGDLFAAVLKLEQELPAVG